MITEVKLEVPLEKMVFRKARVWSMVIISTLGMLQFGYILAVLNTLMPYFTLDVYHFDEKQKVSYSSILNSVMTIGAALGALIAGPITKKIGRRPSMIIIDVVVLLATALTLVPNLTFLIIGRIIGGFCIGFNSTVCRSLLMKSLL